MEKQNLHLKIVVAVVMAVLLVFGVQSVWAIVDPSVALSPTLLSLTPNQGPDVGGTMVTISGTNLSSLTSVTFGGIAATLGVTSSTSVVVTTPAHLAGLVDVAVTTSGGTATLPGAYTFLAPVVDEQDGACPNDKKNKKVTVCHIPPGNPEQKKTLCLPDSAIKAHLDHGDYLGICK